MIRRIRPLAEPLPGCRARAQTKQANQDQVGAAARSEPHPVHQLLVPRIGAERVQAFIDLHERNAVGTLLHGTIQPPEGIAFDELDTRQQQMLLQLVRAYAAKYRQGIVDQIAKRTPIVNGDGMFFAWAGSFEPGKGHYYRIQTPHFIFEYDNVQTKANHVHAVWRSFDGDFGEDLLLKHYEQSPHHKHE